jgi:hypothetical protein
VQELAELRATTLVASKCNDPLLLPYCLFVFFRFEAQE